MELLQLLNKEHNEFRSRVKAISDFMKMHQIPINFQVKVRKYLEDSYKNRTDAKQDLRMLEFLSPGLRIELQGLLMRKTIVVHAFFADMDVNLADVVCSGLEMS